MANVLITGGAGYVGSVVTGAFLAAGHEVTVLDTLESGGQGLLAYASDRRFRFQRGDVRDARAIGEAMRGQDVIVHLAAVVGFGACNVDPRRAASVNVEGTQTLLAARDPRQLLLYASTGSVYGAVSDGLCHENLDPAPLSVYGRTKLQAERLVLQSGNATAFRFATAFGMSPRMRVDLLVNGFVYAARKHRSIVIYDRNARRTFIHVRDMARAFLFALDHATSMDRQVYNAGSERLNLTKDEIAALLRQRLTFETFYGPVGGDEDQRDYAVSYEKLRALGYETAVSIEEGLDELLRGVDLLAFRSPYGDV
jgi:nucleoside-diphosphate-sugar epimerase